MSTRMLAVSVNLGLGGYHFTPDQLATIGSVAVPGTQLEMTPFKQFYVTVDESRAEETEQLLAAAGLRVMPSGFFTKNLQACHFCRGAEDAGLDLALQLDAAITGLEVPVPIKVGYAGCGLGTSEPLTKDISVVKMRGVYDIYVGGDAKGIKPVFAQLFMEKLRSDEIIPIVLGTLHYYKSHAKGKEKFRKFVERMTMEHLKEAVAS